MIWQEPVRGSYPDPRLFGLSGIEQMRAALHGHSPPPPIHHLTGMIPTEVGAGTSTFVMPATPWLLAPPGMISGGTLAMLADGPLGVAVQTTLPPATGYATSELSMNFVKAATPDGGTLIARGRLVHGGRSLALTEVFVDDARGRLLAHGTSRCVIFPPIDPAPEPPDPLPVLDPVPSDPPDPYLRPVEGGVLPAEAWDDRSGLDVLRALIAGEGPWPPIYHLTGLHPTEADEGTATFVMPATGWLTSPIGTVEGGAIAMLADSALACAVQTTVPAGSVYATLDLKVNFVRPVRPDGRDLTARATVVHRGKTIAIATGEVRNSEEKLVATTSGTSMILAGRSWSHAGPLTPDEDPPPEER